MDPRTETRLTQGNSLGKFGKIEIKNKSTFSIQHR